MRNLDHASGVDYERIGPDWLWDAIVSRLPAWVWERCGKDFAWHYFGKPVAADLVDTDLQCLSELPDLRGLRIRQGDRTCARVAQLQPLSKLERLELEVGVDGEEILWASPRLKVLKVCGVRSRAELPDIRVLRHLKAVDVSQMHHTGDAMEYLGSVPGLIILDQPED
jgi:hypothetical protein